MSVDRVGLMRALLKSRVGGKWLNPIEPEISALMAEAKAHPKSSVIDDDTCLLAESSLGNNFLLDDLLLAFREFGLTNKEQLEKFVVPNTVWDAPDAAAEQLFVRAFATAGDENKEQNPLGPAGASFVLFSILWFVVYLELPTDNTCFSDFYPNPLVLFPTTTASLQWPVWRQGAL